MKFFFAGRFEPEMRGVDGLLLEVFGGVGGAPDCLWVCKALGRPVWGGWGCVAPQDAGGTWKAAQACPEIRAVDVSIHLLATR